MKDASYQANSTGGDGDCLCHVCVRLLSDVDAGCGDAMLQHDALLAAQPRSQPGMLQDHAVHALGFCTAACFIPLDYFRHRAAGV